jgi:H/ACA ribonucleoprotein complex non-core subunit NAF1
MDDGHDQAPAEQQDEYIRDLEYVEANPNAEFIIPASGAAAATGDGEESEDDLDYSALPPELREAMFADEPGFPGGEMVDDSSSDDDEDVDAAAGDAAGEERDIYDMSDSDDDEGMGVITLTGDIDKDRSVIAALMSGPARGGRVGAGLYDGSDDDEEEGGSGGNGGALFTKNEAAVAPPPAPVPRCDRLSLKPAGVVYSVSPLSFVVEATGVSDNALDLTTPIYLGSGEPIGRIEDVFGPVSEPYYVVRPAATLVDAATAATAAPLAVADAGAAAPATDTAAAAAAPAPLPVPTSISEGVTVYYSTQHSAWVLAQQLRALKGSDASNAWDEEVAEEEQEYSDDEAEAAAKTAKKNARKQQAQQGQAQTQTQKTKRPAPTSAVAPAAGAGAGASAKATPSQQRPAVSVAGTSASARPPAAGARPGMFGAAPPGMPAAAAAARAPYGWTAPGSAAGSVVGGPVNAAKTPAYGQHGYVPPPFMPNR